MNGKKAKMIRGLAAMNKSNQHERSCHGTNTRNKTVLHPTAIDIDGKPTVMARYTTSTYKLNPGVRLMYKMLKKSYLQTLRNPTAKMLAN